MKRSLVVLIAIFIILISGCSLNNSKAIKDKFDELKTENKIMNSKQILYQSENAINKVFVQKDNQIIDEVFIDNAYWIAVKSNYIYINTVDTISKINVKDLSIEVIIDDTSIQSAIIKDNRIYYTTDVNTKMYDIKTNEVTLLVNYPSLLLEDNLWYVEKEEKTENIELWGMRIPHTSVQRTLNKNKYISIGIEKLESKRIAKYKILNGAMYYVSVNNTINKISKDLNDLVLIEIKDKDEGDIWASSKADWGGENLDIDIVDDWIYYNLIRSYKEYVEIEKFKMKLDGSQNQSVEIYRTKNEA